jgi:Family of unknown function (DUF6308)
MFGGLDVPECLLDPDHAADLLRRYLEQDENRYLYSGAAFDFRPEDDDPNAITSSDLIALTMLGIRVTGHEALSLMRYQAAEIRRLLSDIPADSTIEDEASSRLLDQAGPGYELWRLLRCTRDQTKTKHLGPVAAGKILARKRPSLFPMADSRTALVFNRPAPGFDSAWWEDVRSAALDQCPKTGGPALWEHLAAVRTGDIGAAHLPTLRVLDIVAWTHVEVLGRGHC